LPEDFEGDRQLYGVIGAQRVRIRRPRGIVEQGGRDLIDGLSTGKMQAESMEDRRCRRLRERLTFPAAGDGGGYLDDSDPGQIDRVR
jgi:hypothetical protein